MRALGLAFLLIAGAAQASAPPDPADPAEALAARCEAAAVLAAREAGVPERLLRAISLAESGRRLNGRLRPWPWTVNMEGEGRWFDSPAPLLAWVRGRQAEGARSFDLGCFQVNHLWHGHEFDGLEDMLSPETSARYAAQFLKELHAASGSWETAAGHYHSRTPELAERYRARVLALMEGLGEAPDAGALLAAGRAAARERTRPRPLPGGPLIDLVAARAPLIGAAPGAEAPRGSLAAVAMAEAGAGLLRPGRPLLGPAPEGAAR